mmetsp:Transcript_59799/g.141472  ORF Transcript_59799/g.141472 Transcript_59799/m.141472 type:complete len:423 (+) Transcript_59799:441-1709(+)
MISPGASSLACSRLPPKPRCSGVPGAPCWRRLSREQAYPYFVRWWKPWLAVDLRYSKKYWQTSTPPLSSSPAVTATWTIMVPTLRQLFTNCWTSTHWPRCASPQTHSRMLSISSSLGVSGELQRSELPPLSWTGSTSALTLPHSHTGALTHCHTHTAALTLPRSQPTPDHRNPDLASALDAGGNSPLALLVSAMLHRAPTGDCPELIALADRLAAAQPSTITQRDKAACTPFLDLVRCQSVTATAVLHRFMVHDPVAVSATGCVDGIECLPLHAALRRRTLRTAPCLETVEVLLRAYPEAVVKTSAGSTPLEIALQQNWELPVMENLCTMLLDTWFRVDTTDLHCVIQPHPLAAFCGNRTIVENMTVLNTFCDHFPSLRDGAADHRDAIRRKAATTGASPAAINELDELIMSDKGVLVKAAR